MRRLVALSLLSGLLSGCAWLPSWRPDLATTPTPPSAGPTLSVPLTGQPQANKEELPKDQALKLALAAGEEFMKHGHDAEALQQFERARQLDPKAAVARKLARLHERLGNFPQALAEYKKAIDQTPNDADLCNDVGYCYFQMGDYPAAETWLRRARTLKPQHARATVNLGMAVGMQNRQQEALALFGEVLSPADAYANVAFIYLKQGRRDDALAAYQQALALQPDHKLAAAVLARLKPAANAPEPSGDLAGSRPVASGGNEIQQVTWKPAPAPVPTPMPIRAELQAPIAGKSQP